MKSALVASIIVQDLDDGGIDFAYLWANTIGASLLTVARGDISKLLMAQTFTLTTRRTVPGPGSSARTRSYCS